MDSGQLPGSSRTVECNSGLGKSFKAYPTGGSSAKKASSWSALPSARVPARPPARSSDCCSQRVASPTGTSCAATSRPLSASAGTPPGITYQCTLAPSTSLASPLYFHGFISHCPNLSRQKLYAAAPASKDTTRIIATENPGVLHLSGIAVSDKVIDPSRQWSLTAPVRPRPFARDRQP